MRMRVNAAEKALPAMPKRARKYMAMFRLSATVAADTRLPLGLKASARAVKLTPPPIYEPVIMAAILGNPST